MTTTLNTPTRLQLGSLPKKAKLQAQIKIGGSWRGMGTYQTTSAGRAWLRALTLTYPATYYVRLKQGKQYYYVRIQGG